jgi:DNA-directed RNA polymerase specialized sigma24 family protein
MLTEPSNAECPLPADDKQAFLSDLVRDYGLRLRRYLAARLRSAVADVPDLV